MKDILANDKDVKKLANNFNSVKTPDAIFNTKDRLDYYEDRKKDSSCLPENLLIKIKLKYVGKFLGSYKIYGVNGDLLRTKCDIDFTSGGNPARYAYTPEGEVWAEESLNPNDFAAIIIHEFVECIIMKYKGKSYEDAHDKASAIEMQFRKKYPKQEDQSIKTEIKKAEKFIVDFIRQQKTS